MWKKGEIELSIEPKELWTNGLGEEASVPEILGEDILQNALTFALGEEDEIYEGYGRRGNAYPYRLFNTYGKDLKKQTFQTVRLENKYLQAVFLPELGGRLWSLIDKETGRNLLYTNDVLQFRNLSVRNAWFSGGVEWNIGVIGHTPFTTAPLYTATLQNENGTPVLRMYEYERIRKVFYQMDFWLEEEDRQLNCRMRVVNENDQVVPMYWWSNMAVPEVEQGRVIVPSEKAYTFVDGKVFKVDIPVVDGVDVTHYEGIPKSIDYFFEIPEESPKYIASVDKTGYGLLHVSTSRLRSRKLFSWGHTTAAKHWQEFLTKEAGPYLEIQAGLAKTQYGCLPMAPHTAWEWLEQYGPVQLTPEQLEKPHLELSQGLTEELLQSQRVSCLEATLKATKALAKTPAELLLTGSGYGAVHGQKESTKHLEFCLKEESLKHWQNFRKTGVLHEPNPMERPDEFWEEDEIFTLLKDNQDKNENNWYAHYHLGIGYYLRGKQKKARKALKMSFALKENPWACHALGCIYLQAGRKEKAAEWMLRGLQLENKDASYLKEGFKILFLCEAYEEIIERFEALEEPERSISRLQFYYISAKYQQGQYEEALALLEQDGGLVMEDLREGEYAVEQLWKQLTKALGGNAEEVPYQYLFRTF